MARALQVHIVFHGPFRVASGSASDGLDATYRADNPLPASTLKGLMRAQAERTLALPEELVGEVFGHPQHASPWWWSDAELDEPREMVRTQLRIDEQTATAFPGAVRTNGQLWPRGGRFTVAMRDAIPMPRVTVHRAVLEAAARAVTGLGSDRRRGLGWVSFQPDAPWDESRRQMLLSLRRERP